MLFTAAFFLTKAACLKSLRLFGFFLLNGLLKRLAQTKRTSENEDHTKKNSIMILFSECGLKGVNPRILKSF